jgi:defect-in-organelle-trafficking protein DotC
MPLDARRHSRGALIGAGLLAVVLCLSGCESKGNLAQGQFVPPPPPVKSTDPGAVPPSLGQLQGLEAIPLGDNAVPPLVGTALRETALALGAQGGLAYRSAQINDMLDRNALELSRIYHFDRLSIPAPSGSIVMPPVVTETQQEYIVQDDGQAAATADRVYRIIRPARIVTAPPNWRTYLVRTWTGPEIPPGELLPKTEEQRRIWIDSVADGWQRGADQADAIFQADLARLERDLEGMARYRALVAQGIIHHIYLAESDRGITGGGDELKVGDRMVRISAPASLEADDRDWSPILVPSGDY